MKTTDPHHRCQLGLTLTELVVALAVAGILLAAGYGIFTTQQKTYAVQDQIVQVQQQTRAAINLLTRDLRMAGHGVPEKTPVQIGGHAYGRVVTHDGEGLTLIGCFGAPAAYLSKSADSGDTRVFVSDVVRFNTHDRRYIFVGEFDKAIINDVQGNALVLDQPLRRRYPTTRLTAEAHPGDTEVRVANTAHVLVGDILTLGNERLHIIGVSGGGLTFRYPLEAQYPSGIRVNPIPVYYLQALRYTLGDRGRIKREDLSTHGGGGQTVGGNIEALSLEDDEDAGVYRIRLTGSADVPDETGRLRGRTYEVTVRVRNPYQ